MTDFELAEKIETLHESDPHYQKIQIDISTKDKKQVVKICKEGLTLETKLCEINCKRCSSYIEKL